MGDIVVQSFMTLDGVVQGPGGSDEDRDNGFEHGGWQNTYEGGEELITEWESRTGALLLGRRTYDIWASYWPQEHGDFADRYNRIPKHVASRTQDTFTWTGTHHLGDDLATAVRAIEVDPGEEIRVWGSTQLVRSLAEADLVDEYRILTYPLVLGSGKRLFGDGFPLSRLRLVDTLVLDSGVVVTTYRRG